MNLAELQAEFSGFTIRSEPDPTCPVCKGRGWKELPQQRKAPCLCACLDSAPDDAPGLRGELAASLAGTAKKLREEMT